MRRVEAIWAFMAIDPTDGTEGVVGALTREGWRPLVCGDSDRVELFRQLAQEVARNHQVGIRIVRFDTRRDLEVIDAASGWQWAKLQ